MKPFPKPTTARAGECAREVLETAPLVMTAIRSEMRRIGGSELSVPQFRTLLFIGRHPEASLSDAAEHIGLTLPSLSKLVDSLVAAGLVERGESSRDRRRLTLHLTSAGNAVLRRVRGAALRSLERRLSALSEEERRQVGRGMRLLRTIFGSPREAQP